MNGNQYTSGRNVIMVRETLTLEEAKQQIEALVKKNDDFVFTIAKLREEIEAWRKENIKTYDDYLSKIDELKKGSKLRIAELESEIETKQDSVPLVDFLEWKTRLLQLMYPESHKWTEKEVLYELEKWQDELAKLPRRR